MHKFVILFCLAAALPFNPALAAPPFGKVVAYIAREVVELKALAAGARALEGAAKEDALRQGRAALSKLNPIFQDADREARRAEQQALIEKWRERADRTSDFVEVVERVKKLDELGVEILQLEDEFCGPRDLYQFSGDCPEAEFRPYGSPR